MGEILILDNVFYIVNLIFVVTFVLGFWILLDSLKNKFKVEILFRALSFIVFAVGTIVELLFSYRAASVLIFLGLVILLVGILREKINPVPKRKLRAISPVVLILGLILPLINLIISLVCSYQVWLRMSKGLVKEYKPLLLFLLSFSGLMFFQTIFFFVESENIFLSQLSREYGFIWILYLLVKITALIFLINWLYGYIRFRIYPLLFCSLASIIALVGLISAMLNSLILFSSSKEIYLDKLEKNANGVELSIEFLKERLLLSTNSMSENEFIRNFIETKNLPELEQLTSVISSYDQNFDEVIITDRAGAVLLSTKDPLLSNADLSKDLFINRALAFNEDNVGIFSTDEQKDRIEIRATSRIQNAEQITVGTITIIYNLDNSYADFIKDQIGIDTIIFAENKRIATTLVGEDGVTRLINLQETNVTILDSVLKNGQVYLGETYVRNVPFNAAVIPLNDASGITVGMIFIGEPQELLLEYVRLANERVLVIATLTILLGLIPSKFLADFIFKNNQTN